MLKRGYVDTPEGQIHYHTAGQGEHLMLIHQAPRSSRMFGKLMPLLAKEYRVFAMDMLGCGNSDSPPQVIEIGYLAQNVAHVLDALEIERCHLFGIHTGARVSGDVAAGWPDRIASLMLMGYSFMEERDQEILRNMSPMGGGAPKETVPDGSHLMRIWGRAHSNAVKFLVHTSKPTSELLRESASLGIRAQQGIDAFMTSEHLEHMDRYMVDALQAKGRFDQVHDQGLLEYDSRARLSLVKAETLYINSDSPYEAEFSNRGQTISKIIPRCDAVTLSPADDNAPEFNAPGLAAIMLDFLGKHPL